MTPTLLIDTSNRLSHKLSLLDSTGQVLGFEEGAADVLILLDQLLEKYKIKLTDIKEIKAKMEGESRVGINIGVAAANALNYALGLKKLEELKFPDQEPDPFE